MYYSSHPLVETALLPNNSVLITEVSFGESEHYMYLQYLLLKQETRKSSEI